MSESDALQRSDEAFREGTAFPDEPPAVEPDESEAAEGFGEAAQRPRLRPTENAADERGGGEQA